VRLVKHLKNVSDNYNVTLLQLIGKQGGVDMGRFQLIKKGDQWRFNLQAGNYEPILHSEAYETKSGATNGIESVRKNSQREDAFEVETAKNGQYYFVLRATNHQIIGQSETYETEGGCKNGIESVQKNAPDAEIVE
jgi:uncharacterized protein YegP (UPF0339 family)